MQKKLTGRIEGEPPLNFPFPNSKIIPSGEARPYFRPMSWILHTVVLIMSFFSLVRTLHNIDHLQFGELLLAFLFQ